MNKVENINHRQPKVTSENLTTPQVQAQIQTQMQEKIITIPKQNEGSMIPDGLIAGTLYLLENKGPMALLRGWEPTMIGYLYYGVTVYPLYEFFKRSFISSTTTLYGMDVANALH